MTDIGIPFIIAAPSGAGKTSLVKAAVDAMPNLVISISYTTRKKRPTEKEGEHYHFVDESTFKRMQEEGAFLESARVFDHYYGTGKNWVHETLLSGKDVILEIDWQGAQQVRGKLPGSVGIFILPPAHTVLEARLKARAQDDPIVIAKRMQEARVEVSHYREFDYLIVNDDFQAALHDFQVIVEAEHLRQERHGQKLSNLIANLLA